MTGPEHYTEAERLLSLAQNTTVMTALPASDLLRAAAVHAKLAEVAWHASGNFSRSTWMAATLGDPPEDPSFGVTRP